MTVRIAVARSPIRDEWQADSGLLLALHVAVQPLAGGGFAQLLYAYRITGIDY